VPAYKRRHYVHGAVWFGETQALVEMCSILSDRVREDLKNNFVAKWHDESHLNWYFSNFKVTLLDNRFSYVSAYPLLSNMASYIETVPKNSNELRKYA
jgi:hypothetical protein